MKKILIKTLFIAILCSAGISNTMQANPTAIVSGLFYGKHAARFKGVAMLAAAGVVMWVIVARLLNELRTKKELRLHENYKRQKKYYFFEEIFLDVICDQARGPDVVCDQARGKEARKMFKSDAFCLSAAIFQYMRLPAWKENECTIEDFEDHCLSKFCLIPDLNLDDMGQLRLHENYKRQRKYYFFEEIFDVVRNQTSHIKAKGISKRQIEDKKAWENEVREIMESDKVYQYFQLSAWKKNRCSINDFEDHCFRKWKFISDSKKDKEIDPHYLEDMDQSGIFRVLMITSSYASYLKGLKKRAARSSCYA